MLKLQMDILSIATIQGFKSCERGFYVHLSSIDTLRFKSRIFHTSETE